MLLIKKVIFLKKLVCINMLVGLSILGTTELYAQPLPPLFVRENINQFMNKPMRIAALKRGIEVMKQRPVSDPTSWAFQANIHGSNDASQPLWNQCQHRHWWFLAWHRAYLFYLERMLQKAAAEPRLRIPYWNYTELNSRSLPAPFLDSTSVLYVPGRQMTTVTDEVTPSSVNTSIALSRTNFAGSDAQLGFGGGQEAAPVQFPFENKAGSLEKLPHNAIHVQVGGIMQNARTAAIDPIFWLHHCNIDRLWEKWLKSGQGRANPTDPAFLNATFTLYNENGVPVTHQVKDFLGDIQKLGYYYDDQPPGMPVANAESNAGAEALASQQLEDTLLSDADDRTPVALIALAKPNESDIKDGAPATENSPEVMTLADTRFAKPVTVLADPVTLSVPFNLQSPHTKRMLTQALPPEKEEVRFLLVLDDLKFDKAPTNIYELYLNLPTANHTTMGQSKYYIGPLSFFESDVQMHHAHHEKKSETFDITEVIHTLQRDRSLNTNQLTVTIVPVGIMRKGRPTIPTHPLPLQLNNLKIVTVPIQKPEEQGCKMPHKEPSKEQHTESDY